MSKRKWSESEDMADDSRRGIKQGSKQDNELDRKRGLGKKHRDKYHVGKTILAALLLMIPYRSHAQSVPAISAGQSAAAEGHHQIDSNSGDLYSLSVTAGATAGNLMIFNATSAPADGAVTPAYCYPVSANQTLGIQWIPPVHFNTGISVVFSSTSGAAACFTKTESTTVVFMWQAK